MIQHKSDGEGRGYRASTSSTTPTNRTASMRLRQLRRTLGFAPR